MQFYVITNTLFYKNVNWTNIRYLLDIKPQGHAQLTQKMKKNYGGFHISIEESIWNSICEII